MVTLAQAEGLLMLSKDAPSCQVHGHSFLNDVPYTTSIPMFTPASTATACGMINSSHPLREMDLWLCVGEQRPSLCFGPMLTSQLSLSWCSLTGAMPCLLPDTGAAMAQEGSSSAAL